MRIRKFLNTTTLLATLGFATVGAGLGGSIQYLKERADKRKTHEKAITSRSVYYTAGKAGLGFGFAGFIVGYSMRNRRD